MKQVLVTLMLLSISEHLSAQTPALTIPDFQFYRQDKSLFTNKNLRPGQMSFFFFFDPECDHCQHAMKNLNVHYNEYKKTAVYLISADSKEKITGFINKYASDLKNKNNVIFLQDDKNEFMTKFNPRRFPAMFLYSPDKKLADYEDNEESMFRFLKLLNKSAK